MRLASWIFTYATIAAVAAEDCSLKGKIGRRYDCFNCPASECGIAHSFTISAGTNQAVGCRWSNGASHLGKK